MASDVLIVGGGVIGLSIARSLAMAALGVTLFDSRQPGREASWAGAGILPPTRLGDSDDPLTAMTRRTHALWPELSSALRATTGIDNGFRRCGGLRLLSDPGDTHELTFRSAEHRDTPELPADWIAAGTEAEPVSHAELRRLEPALDAGISQAIHLPELCQVRNPWHLQALLADCRRLGVDVRPESPIESLEIARGRVRGVHTNSGMVAAGRVIVASGAWSTQLLPRQHWPVEIEPVRGQIVLLRQPNARLRRVIEVGSRYLVPRDDGRVLIGSTEERAGFVKQTTQTGVQGLLRFAVGLVPELRHAERETEWAGLRPHADGGRPFIGAVPDCEGLFLAAGHFRAGLHLSPLTAEIMRDLIVASPAG